MAFRFPLEGVHRVRLGQERMERLKLESIATEIAVTRNRLLRLQEITAQTAREFQLRMGAGISASELHFESVRAAGLVSRRDSLRAHLREMEQRRLTQLRIFLNVRQKREILANLRQQMLERYRLEQSRHEQQQLDDLFLMRNFNVPYE